MRHRQKITYPRTCGNCQRVYSNSPNYSRHLKDCERFNKQLIGLTAETINVTMNQVTQMAETSDEVKVLEQQKAHMEQQKAEIEKQKAEI